MDSSMDLAAPQLLASDAPERQPERHPGRVTPEAGLQPQPTSDNQPAAASRDDASPAPHPLPFSWPQIWLLLLSLAAIISAALIPLNATGSYLTTLAILVCMFAAWCDAATARVPNPLTYTAILLGLAINTLVPFLAALHLHTAERWLGAPGMADSFLGALLCLGIGIACMLLPIGGKSSMGGGDFKLLIAIGAITGASHAPLILFLALTLAVPLALLNLILGNRLNTFVRYIALELTAALYTKKLAGSDLPLSGRFIPLAIPLCLGILVAKLWPNNPVSQFLEVTV